ncbi:hypothetical protein LguiA_001022 [Lonicera macranthoides]
MDVPTIILVAPLSDDDKFVVKETDQVPLQEEGRLGGWLGLQVVVGGHHHHMNVPIPVSRCWPWISGEVAGGFD